MKIKRKTLIDSVIALASLRGDFTGRGSLLVDTDFEALAVIADRVVPATLSRLGISFTTTEQGWIISSPPSPEATIRLPAVEEYLVRVLLSHISGTGNMSYSSERDSFVDDTLPGFIVSAFP